MSDSYHVNRTHFRRLSKKDLAEMASDPNSLLQQWSEKFAVKKKVKRARIAARKKS